MANISHWRPVSRRHSYLSAKMYVALRGRGGAHGLLRANVSQQCLTSLEMGLKCRVKKKQQKKTKLFLCHGSTLDLKIKNMETSKQEILCKCCRAKVVAAVSRVSR